MNGRQIAHGQDFREILDDKAVDAMVIATRNHWHAPATLMGSPGLFAVRSSINSDSRGERGLSSSD